jgi:hypothetical protein
MSERAGQLEVVDDTGALLGFATKMVAAGATVVNGVLTIPGVSAGAFDALSYKGASSPSAAEFSVLADLTGRVTVDPSSVELRTGNTVFTVGDFSAGLLVNNNSWVVFDDATHSMDLGDVDGWGNMSHIAIEDDDQQVRLHATTVKIEKGLLALGVAGTALGRLTLAGNTSGVVTVQPAAVAGTWTLTLPVNAGTNRFPLLTNGSGVTSWAQLGAADISGLGTAAVLNTGTASGDIPILGAGGKLASSVLPAIAITDTFVVASQAAMLALTAETGDVAVRTDLNKSFILAGANPATLAHWQELLTPTDTVISVNGQTGVVVLNTSHISEHASNLYYTNTRADARIAAAVGVSVQAFDATLSALAAFNSNGLLVQTAADTFTARTITGTANQVSVSNGSGVSGNPTLSLPQDIHTGASPTFTGLTLSGNLSTAGVSSSLIPSVTDTYDLGSSTKLWRKGWLSELDAVLFAQNTVSLIGGWLMATKNEGAIPVGQDIGTGDTSIDFGQAMTANDFVLFRAAGSVEYVQVGSVVSGTRYNVTRNLDGSGANAWPAGSVYAVLGNTTNGRIEINANSTPRISLIKQGATYNAQTELLRVGDLNGGWGYGAETYGFAAGEYAAGKAWVSVDPTNGIRIGLHSVINGQWDTSGNLALGQVATNSGNAFWNNSNKRFEFRGGAGGTAVQAYVDTSGTFVMSSAEVSGSLAVTGNISAAAGQVLFDAGGLTLQAFNSSTSSGGKNINFTDGSTDYFSITGTYSPGISAAGSIGCGLAGVTNTLSLAASSVTATKNASVTLQASSNDSGTAEFRVTSTSAGGTYVYTTSGTRVSIGDGAYPSTALHVVGAGRFTSDLTVSGILSVAGNAAFDTTTLVVDATNNRVGIGTASPGADLDVQRNFSGDIMLRMYNTLNTSAGGAKMRFVGGTGATMQHQWTDDTEWLASIAVNASLGFSFRVRKTGDTNDEATLATGEALRIDRLRNVVVGTAALATNATSGFFYIPSGAGVPTGTPTTHTGRVPMYVDSTNNKFYAYIGGAWRGVTLT